MQDHEGTLPVAGAGRPSSAEPRPAHGLNPTVSGAAPGSAIVRLKSGPGDEPGLREYLRIFAHHYRLMAVVGLLPFLVVLAYTVLQPKRYRAQAVLIRSESRQGIEAPIQGNSLASLSVAFKTMKSPGVVELTYAKLPPAMRSGFSRGRMAATTQGLFAEKDQELEITATDTDAARAAAVANAFAAALAESAENKQKDLTNRLAENATKSLDKKSEALTRISSDILKERAKLPQSGKDKEFLPLPFEAEELMNRLARLETARQEAELRAREIDERIEEVRRLLREAGLQAPEVDLADLERGLLRVELDLSRAETKYTPSHPTYIKLKNERDELLKIVRSKAAQRAAAPQLHLEQIQRDVVLLEAERAGIKARIEAISDMIGKDDNSGLRRDLNVMLTNGLNKEYADLLRQQKVLEGTVANLRKYLENLDVSNISAQPRLVLLTEATTPGQPFSPRWLVNLAVGLALALVLALIGAFIAESLEDRIRDQGDLFKKFRLPFLGPVPHWEEGQPLLIDLAQPSSVIADVYGVLRNNIGYALPPRVPRAILVASSVVGEGKSTIAANLAISYCLDGNNVLLIDTDLRRPRAHRLFESLCTQAAESPGLSGYLTGRAELDTILHQTNVPNLAFVSAGKGAVNPSKLLGSEEMRHLMQKLSAQFDVVIMDGPAVLPVVDSTVVSQFASGVVLVVACKHAPAEQVATAISRIEHVRAPIIGMILNRQPGGSRGYYHYYGSRYGYGYHYGYSSHYGPPKEPA